jgi:hypothetical protein
MVTVSDSRKFRSVTAEVFLSDSDGCGCNAVFEQRPWWTLGAAAELYFGDSNGRAGSIIYSLLWRSEATFH